MLSAGFLAACLSPAHAHSSLRSNDGTNVPCAKLLLVKNGEQSKQDFKRAFLGLPVDVDSEVGHLQIGIVDVDYPGVAEAISHLLVRSISDARESNPQPGHLPDHLVEDVIQQYISPEKVKTFWRYHGHRFAVMNSEGHIVATMLLGIDKDTLIYLNRWTNNVVAADYPGVKPVGYHQMMNLCVSHELRRSKVASVMLDTVSRHFRHLFNGKGMWMRADPPWHDKLTGLGFIHDPSMDSFLPENVEPTLGLPHPEYNAKFRCSCSTHHPENPPALTLREYRMETQKLQYFSFTRDFVPSPARQRQAVQKIDVLIVGGGIAGTAFALKLREINPKLTSLIITRDEGFALSGHGHLYPMTNMEQFRFPGSDSVQPMSIGGRIYPGEVERALIANREHLNVWVGETAELLNPDGSVLLTSGMTINARSIVIATGMSALQSNIFDDSSRDRVEDFISFSRALAQLPYVSRSPGAWGTVAIIGDGSAGRTLARQLEQSSGGVARQVRLIGKNATGETVTQVSFDQKQFRIKVRKENGESASYSADRVVSSLGYNNNEAQSLASLLKTSWVIGAGAFSGAPPSIVQQIAALSDQVLQLNSQLEGVKP